MTITIKLPWPSRDLHPNARVHWSRKARATKAARYYAYYHAREKGIKPLESGELKVSVLFNPPDRRKHDLDGVFTSMKPSLDGLADAIGIDDSKWWFSIKRGEVKKNGLIQIQMEPIS